MNMHFQNPLAGLDRSARATFYALCALLVLLALGPWWASRGTMRLLVEFFYMLSLAQLWNLLAGFVGLISVGQQAFVGLGGYFLFALVILAGVPVLMALPIAAIATALLAIPAAKLLFRMQGAYFAIGSWVVAEVFRLLAAQVSALGGGSGISLPAQFVKAISASRWMRESTIYWIALGILAVVIIGMWFLLRSGTGLALAALRDDEEGARASGVQVERMKFRVFTGVALITGLIGALIFVHKLRVTPEAAFSVTDWTVIVMFIAVIGGIGSIEGPILGAIAYFVLREQLADLGNWFFVILGLATIAIMLYEPRGLWGLVQRWRTMVLFPTQRLLMPPDQDEPSSGGADSANPLAGLPALAHRLWQRVLRPGGRYRDEELLAMIAEENAGTSVQDVLARYRIGPNTYARHKKRLAGLEVSDLERLRALEADNADLKTALAEQMVDNATMKRIMAEQALEISRLKSGRKPS